MRILRLKTTQKSGEKSYTGSELRGGTHLEDILPLLAELQNDPDRRVRETIIHVSGQISYKEGCLEKVISALGDWENRKLVEKALEEILDVRKRYEKFSARSYEEAREYLEQQFEEQRRLRKEHVL